MWRQLSRQVGQVGARLSGMTGLSGLWPGRPVDPAAAYGPALQLTDEEILTLLQRAQARDAESGVPDAALTPEARRERTARYGELILTEILARRQRAQATRRAALGAGALVVAVAAIAAGVTGWRPFRASPTTVPAPAVAGRVEPSAAAPAMAEPPPAAVAPVLEHTSAPAGSEAPTAAADTPPRASAPVTAASAAGPAVPVPAPAVARTKEAVPPRPAAPAAVVTVVGYAVQVAAVPDVAQAHMLRDRLVEGGYPAYLAAVVVDGRTMHRVRIGPLASKPAADTLAQRLEADGYATPWIVRQESGAVASPGIASAAPAACGDDAAPCATADGR